MRRIAVINQKGGVGKTTTCANLGAALARSGRAVLVIDLDPQANLSMHLGQELYSEDPSTYTVLLGQTPLEAAIRPTHVPGLSIVPAHIDLSGAELELASTIGRETLLRDAIDDWERAARERTGSDPVDYVILDCPPSLGLLSVNGLAAVREVLIAVQTEFFALQGMSKLVEVVQLLRRRLNPELRIRGILPCLYDSRLRLAREVLAEVRRFFPGQVFRISIRTNVKLAEAPSHGLTIFDYDPLSSGAADHLALAQELMAQESSPPSGPPGDESFGTGAGALEERLAALAKGARRQPEGDRTPAGDATPIAPAPPSESCAGPALAPLDPAERHPELELDSEASSPFGDGLTVGPAARDREAETRASEDTPLSHNKGPFGVISHLASPHCGGNVAPTHGWRDIPAQIGTSAPDSGALGVPRRAGIHVASPRASTGEERESIGGGDVEDHQDAVVLIPQSPPEQALLVVDPGGAEPGHPDGVPTRSGPHEGGAGGEEPTRTVIPHPAPASRWNFGGLYGEDRVHLAGRAGPRVP